MSAEGRNFTVSLAATAAMTGFQYRVVEIDGTLGVRNETSLGIAQDGTVAAGDHFTAVYLGHAKAYAGAAITAGDRLTTASGGWVIGATSGTGRVGIALATATSGSLVEGLFNFTAAGSV